MKKESEIIFNQVKEFTLGLTHLRSPLDFIINVLIAVTAGILAYFKTVYLDDPNVFQAITWVVFADFFIGVAAAFKKGGFKTHKALKVVWYFTAYIGLAAVVLKVEDGFPSAFWLSEALIMPLLVGQIVSAVKNLAVLGIITNEKLIEILNKIDKHKDDESNQNQEGQSPSL